MDPACPCGLGLNGGQGWWWSGNVDNSGEQLGAPAGSTCMQSGSFAEQRGAGTKKGRQG